MPLGADELSRRFTNHPPRDEQIAGVLDRITSLLSAVAIDFDLVLPDGREKSLAVTSLEECSMWAKAAVARNQEAYDASDED